MKLGIPDANILQVVRGDNTYKESFFSGIVSNNIPASTRAEWVEGKLDYKVGDWVKLDALKCDYVCKVDGTLDYPHDSTDWEKETSNDYRLFDSIPTTKSVLTTDFVGIFNVTYKNYIVGEFIDGASQVIINKMAADGVTVGEEIANIGMTQVIDFECFKCCNPPPAIKRQFGVNLGDHLTCDDEKIQVTIVKSTSYPSLEIGTLTVLRSYYFGCLERGASITNNQNTSFEETQIRKNIELIRWGTTTTLSGALLMDTKDREKNLYLTTSHQGFAFGIVDDLDTVDNNYIDIVMGMWDSSGFPYSMNEKIKVNFTIQGVLA